MADALQLERVSVRRGTRTVVHDLSFAARAGEVLAVLGPNGAGKTSALKAAAGLLPYTGRIEIGGTAREQLTPEATAKRMTFVPQHSLLRAPLKSRQVVAQGRYPHRGSLLRLTRADQRAIDDALTTADVQHLADRAYTQLSFGEQRRVLLARGLATGANVLCLDEPTASLDIAHALSFYRLVRQLAQTGRCVVMVLHQLDDALRHTDRALLLNQGVCVSQGATAEVVTVEHVQQVYGVRMQPAAGLRFSLEDGP